MKITIRRLTSNNKEIGAVLSVPNTNTFGNLHKKYQYEEKLVSYAFTKLYPGKGLHLYREYHSDAPSITVLIDINSIDPDIIDI